MPIYAYRCTNCGFEKDFLQKMSDKPLTKCPQCGKDALVKELSAPGFELRGTGPPQTSTAGTKPFRPLTASLTARSKQCANAARQNDKRPDVQDCQSEATAFVRFHVSGSR